MPRALVRPLLATLLWLLVQGPALQARTLDDLQAETAAPANATGPVPEAAALTRWADTFSQEGDCATAFALRRKALAPQAPARAWAQLAADAACAGRWPEASRALWRALHPAPQSPPDGAVTAQSPLQKFPLPAGDRPAPRQRQAGGQGEGKGVGGAERLHRARLWTSLGRSLEKRSTWRDDWRDAARESYRRALALAPLKEARGRLEALGDDERPLQLKAHYVEKGPAGPRICMVFSPGPSTDEGVHYGDYVRFDPPFAGRFEVSGDRLCGEGGDWGIAYRVHLRSGLPGRGQPLDRDQEFTVAPVHRDADFWFDGPAYVLPHRTRPALTVQSVNQGRVDLELFHVHERNILSRFVQERFRRSLGRWDLRRLRDRLGESVWTGRADLSGRPDRVHGSTLELPRAILAQTGLYVLAMKAPRGPGEAPGKVRTLWLVASDIGLTAYQGRDGLTVQARSLASGRPLAGVEIGLYARNNTPLARILSDADGRVHFAPGLMRARGGRRPVEVTAFGPERGFSFLRLVRPPRDLADRGVGGRPAPGPLDAFLSLDRDIFRPGETLHLTVLVRDDRGRPVPPLPLHLRLTDPRGQPVRERVLQPGPDGAYVEALDLPEGARLGRWELALRSDPGAAPIGLAHFQVAAFRPPRMEAHLRADGPLRPARPSHLRLDARYLFGAPAAGRAVHASLRLEADPEPFPKHRGFHFGPAPLPERVETLPLADTRTDPQGAARIEVRLPAGLQAPYPLRAQVRAEVLDVDGRALPVHRDLKVRHLPLYLGIRTLAGGERLAADSEAVLEFLALDAQGRPAHPAGLHWRLSREEVDYQWFEREGRWDYRRIVHHRPLRDGPLGLDPKGRARVTVALRRGTYRVEALDAHAQVLGALRIQAGSAAAAGTPDKVALGLDRPHYRPGDRARLRIDAPFAGEAALAVAGEGLDALRNLHLKRGRNEVEVPVGGDWGAGRYLLLDLYRPGDRGGGPARALGVIWLALDPAPHRLPVALQIPERARPRSRQTVGIRIPGLGAGETVHLVLAAVDEAVLQMTGFQAADPIAHFFGKRRLGLELRDLYGDLIAVPDRAGGLRSGGGSANAARRGAPPANVRVVSLFRGPVAVDAHGEARIALDLPAFDGRLRLMALAWSRTRMGSAQAPLLVRDPLVVSPSLPRFLALGDRAGIPVLIHNLEAPPGRYHLKLSGDPRVAVDGPADIALELAPGGRALARFQLHALRLGEARLRLSVSGPQGPVRDLPLTLGVRGRYLPVRTHRYGRIPPGGVLRLDSGLLADLQPEDARLDLDLSPRPGLPVAGLLEALQRYPYGCLEQLTSRALPLLQRPRLAARWGLASMPDRARRILVAIDRILEKQTPGGGFGLWSADDDPEPWLSAYALDFLQRAREDGYPVPDFFYERGLRYLQGQAADAAATPEAYAAQAYAHYVLTRDGRARAEDLRYLADQRAALLPTPLALAQLGAALAHQGDLPRARRLFAQAITAPRRPGDLDDYGSLLRDRAAVLHLLAETGQDLADPAPLWADVNARVRRRAALSTQEQAWLVSAAAGVETGGGMTLAQGEAAPRTLDHPLHLRPDAAALRAGLRLRNLGTTPIWTHLGLQGTPRSAHPPARPAFSVERRWYDLQGHPLDPAALAQGQPLVVVLRVRALDRDAHRALVVDLLPAGIGIDNPDLGRADDLEGLAWLPELSTPRYLERLDDRVVAALDLPEVDDPKARSDHYLAYLARAVTPGVFALPPVEVEDMYLPGRRGISQGTDEMRIQR